MHESSYSIPAETVRVEQDIKRSRFIATAGRTAARKDAERFIEGMRNEFPDATHHCWAYVAGNPFDAPVVGMSDDGEPSGTAGKPMLNILQHSGIGEITVVVTRYFGGTKLGTGGLLRAYAGSVQLVLKKLPLQALVLTAAVEITLSHADENAIRWMLDQFRAKNLDVRYGQQIVLRADVPQQHREAFSRQVQNQTHGKAKMVWLADTNKV